MIDYEMICNFTQGSEARPTLWDKHLLHTPAPPFMLSVAPNSRFSEAVAEEACLGGRGALFKSSSTSLPSKLKICEHTDFSQLETLVHFCSTLVPVSACLLARTSLTQNK